MASLSPEQAENKELTPIEALMEDLNENFDATTLELGETHLVSPMESPAMAMATCSDSMGGTEQDLRAVVKTGNELFFVVDTDTRIGSADAIRANTVHSTLLSRYTRGHRAEIIGLARQRDQRDIGPDPRNSLDQDITRPGAYLKVRQSEDGSVELTDLGSVNNITVYTRKDSEETDEPKTLRPIENEMWSVEPAELKQVVRSAKHLN
jgi:hypothetical protein